MGNVVIYNDWTVWNGSINRNVKNYVTLAGSKNADTIGNSGNGVLITDKAVMIQFIMTFIIWQLQEAQVMI